MNIRKLLQQGLPARWRYSMTLVLFAIALSLRWLMSSIAAGLPYITFYPATVAVFYFWGTGPGLLMTVISAAAGYFLFVAKTVHGVDFFELNRLAMFLFGAGSIGFIVRQLRRRTGMLQQALEKLQDSESRFRSFMDNSNFIAWMKDVDGRYIYFSRRYEEVFDRYDGSWVGKTDADLFPTDIAEAFRNTDQQVLTSGLPSVDESMMTLDGRPVYWLSTKFPYVDTAGQRYIGGIAVDITDRKIAEEKIESLAFYDPLTNLPNRRLLLDRLGHVIDNNSRQARLCGLLFIDLDNFKSLNDTFGHSLGDLLLRQVSRRLAGAVRKGDTLARLGGDEFVVLLENLSADELEAAKQAEVVAEKILHVLGEPYRLEGHSHLSTPSIGITLFGDASETIEEPLRRADLAMYQAKSDGRNTWRFYDPDIQAAISARSLLEADLRAAVAARQFVLHYQPQVRGGEIIGAEALVRWQHPQRGMVSPADFIPLAEETGLILPLGCWVLDMACKQLTQWAREPWSAQLTIAVNVSPRQFHQPDFVEQVLASLEGAGANPQRLKLELTEGLLITNVDSVIAKMTALKQHGIGFSLDDFGIGYSSLAYLKQLPLEQLKIDRSFVIDILTDPNDAVIVRTIIGLAESLGLGVIAEGVETAEQCDFLARHGCMTYQGFLFGRPMPIEQFEAHLLAGVTGMV